jgi:hypothetical protein
VRIDNVSGQEHRPLVGLGSEADAESDLAVRCLDQLACPGLHRGVEPLKAGLSTDLVDRQEPSSP